MLRNPGIEVRKGRMCTFKKHVGIMQHESMSDLFVIHVAMSTHLSTSYVNMTVCARRVHVYTNALIPPEIVRDVPSWCNTRLSV